MLIEEETDDESQELPEPDALDHTEERAQDESLFADLDPDNPGRGRRRMRHDELGNVDAGEDAAARQTRRSSLSRPQDAELDDDLNEPWD